MGTKLTEEQRRAMILSSACKIVADTGLWAVNHSAVAKRCPAPTSDRTVRRIIGDKDALWSAVIAHDTSGTAEQQARDMGWTG